MDEKKVNFQLWDHQVEILKETLSDCIEGLEEIRGYMNHGSSWEKSCLFQIKQLRSCLDDLKKSR